MRILNFTVEDQTCVFETVAGVLHFGNVRFKAEKRPNQEDVASISNMEQIEHACKLWGLEPSALSKSLLSRNIGTKEVIMVNYNVAQAQVLRFEFNVMYIHTILSNKFIFVLILF